MIENLSEQLQLDHKKAMSTLEKLHSTILQYLEENVTDYAVMINGVWGSGKTHFIKHKLFPELQKSKNDLKLIYISLFGVTGSNDLNRKIYLEVYPFFNTKVAKTIGVIGKAVISNLGFSGIDTDDQTKLLETVGKIDTNTLIVFDDIERLDGNLLIEILGFINQMVEHNNIKVIISANENEITANIDNNAGNYKKYIEKVVRHKLSFELDFHEIGNEIIDAAGIDARYQSSILDAFNKGETSNLRTLQFVCSMSLKILESLANANFPNSDVKTNVEQITLYFFASIAIDSKANRMKYIDLKKLASWSADKPVDFSQIDFSKMEVLDQGDQKIIREKGGNPQEAFFNRYFSPNQMMYIDSLVEYLESGFWDEKRFLTEITAITNYLTTRGVSESNRLLQTLLNIANVDDEKIDEVVNGVMEYVKAGEYQIDKYLKIYSTIQSFIDEKLIKRKDKELYKEIMQGIDACKDIQPTHYIEDFVSIPSNANEKIKNIYERTIERNQEIKANAFLRESAEHLAEFFADPNAYNRNYLSKSGEFIPCFHFSCTPKDFLKRYSDLTNDVKNDLNAVFYQRQKSGVQMDKAELEWMRDMKKRLEKEIKNEKPSISTINKKRLNLALEQVIKSWAPVEDRLDS